MSSARAAGAQASATLSATTRQRWPKPRAARVMVSGRTSEFIKPSFGAYRVACMRQICAVRRVCAVNLDA
jgi:hypothetical protein